MELVQHENVQHDKIAIWENAIWKTCCMEIMQLDQSATQKECSTKKVQHEKNTTWKKCYMKKTQRGKSATWKKWNMEKKMHKNSVLECRPLADRYTLVFSLWCGIFVYRIEKSNVVIALLLEFNLFIVLMSLWLTCTGQNVLTPE